MSTTLKVSNGDLHIDRVTGQPRLIADVEKCSQDVANVLMTDRLQRTRASRNFQRSYGSELATLRGPTAFVGSLGVPLVSRKIQEAIGSLIDLQDQDPTITSTEHISGISRLLVEAVDTTDYAYFVEVKVKAGTTVPPVTNLEAIRLDHQFPMTSGVVDVPNGGKFN